MLQSGINHRIWWNAKKAGIMAKTLSNSEVTQFLTDPEGAAIRRGDAEPIEDPVLADAEEEEIAELWACDSGNQGA